MDDDSDNTPPIDWEARFDVVKKEHADLAEFVEGGCKRGEISLEAKRAFYKASLRVMDSGGLPTALHERDPIDLAARCVILAQALHEGRKALVATQPDIEDRLNREVPSARGGRSL